MKIIRLIILSILLTDSVAFGGSYWMDEITTMDGRKINIHITDAYCNRLEQSLALTFFWDDTFKQAKEQIESVGIKINKIIPSVCFLDETEIDISLDDIYSLNFRDFWEWILWTHDELMKLCYGL